MVFRWGVIGAGDIADRKVIPAMQAVPGTAVVHVMARGEQKAADLSARHRIPRHSTRPESVFMDPEVDAVYIATPPHLHAELTIAALSAGKHVLCEKPMAMTEAEGRAMICAAEAAGNVLAIAHQMRFHDSYRRARQLIADGCIGKINVIQVEHLVSMPRWFGDKFRADQYRFARIYGGGAILDMAVHDFDAIRYILHREITEVCAFGGPLSFSCDVDDTTTALFRTQDGTLGTLAVGFDTPGGQSTIRLHGSLGTLVVDQKAQSNAGELQMWRDGRWEVFELAPGDPYEAEITHFMKSVGGEEELLISGMEGLRSLRVALACHSSMSLNRPVRV